MCEEHQLVLCRTHIYREWRCFDLCCPLILFRVEGIFTAQSVYRAYLYVNEFSRAV